MKKKTSKSTKRLLMSVVAMAIAIVGAATSTYAWFTMNASPRIGEFRVQATTISGLEIALDTRTATGAVGSGDHYSELNYQGFISGAEIEAWLNSTNAIAGNEYTLAPSASVDGKVFRDLNGNATTGSDGTGTGNHHLVKNSANERAYFEFSVYFRAAKTSFATTSKIALDTFNYAGDAAIDHRDTAGSDVRSYVKGIETDTVTLPTRWTGVPWQVLTATHTEAAFPEYFPTTGGTALFPEIANYITVSGTDITGIKLFKYMGAAGTTADISVNPSTGLLSSAIVAADVTELEAIGITAVAGHTHYLGAATTGTTSDAVKIATNSANALRLSFAEVGKADADVFNTKATESTATVWDPRNNLGNFNTNTAVGGNFALHMHLAEDGRSDILAGLSTYLTATTGHITNRANDATTVGNIGATQLATLSGTVGAASDTDYQYGAMTIRIWLDGWDAECFNGIMGSTANIGLQFKLIA